ncbi:DUF4349 domain-containing protein [Microbacterium lacus]|uniref:DUF4349 domain-containing protein n=1 Tax=Microbacterium lacus TaxID=415217 RepID=UPI00384FF9AB
MNTPAEASALPPLPELSETRIDEIEDALFRDIARSRAQEQTRRSRRGRLWMAGGAAAAVIAVAAIIAPNVGTLVTGGVPGGFAGATNESAPVREGDLGGVTMTDAATGAGLESAVAPEEAAGEREIIASGSATVIVDDLAVAARTIGNSAVARGGYVESMNLGTSGGVVPTDQGQGITYEEYSSLDSSAIYPYPYSPDGAWVTVRVPSDELNSIMEELSDLGEVTTSSINRQDVTEQTVDLRARIEASQASVDRLTELLGQSASVADLIAAESALAERQATLESYQQQLESLEGLVEMSSLSVSLTPVVEPVTADPAGFSDGLAAGWNGLVATLNGIVVALGFMIPWLAIIGLAALIVWFIVRAVRTRKAGPREVAPAPQRDQRDAQERDDHRD